MKGSSTKLCFYEQEATHNASARTHQLTRPRRRSTGNLGRTTSPRSPRSNKNEATHSVLSRSLIVRVSHRPINVRISTAKMWTNHPTSYLRGKWHTRSPVQSGGPMHRGQALLRWSCQGQDPTDPWKPVPCRYREKVQNALRHRIFRDRDPNMKERTPVAKDLLPHGTMTMPLPVLSLSRPTQPTSMP